VASPTHPEPPPFHTFAAPQEFELSEDVQKFSSELARIERMQAAAADSANASVAAIRPGTALGRLTAQRPPTSGPRPAGMPGLPLMRVAP
jgi:hypothetical protein